MSASPSPSPIVHHVLSHSSTHSALAYVAGAVYVLMVLYFISGGISADYRKRASGWYKLGNFCRGCTVLALALAIIGFVAHSATFGIWSAIACFVMYNLTGYAYGRYAINFDFAGTQGFTDGILEGNYTIGQRARQARIKRNINGG